MAVYVAGDVSSDGYFLHRIKHPVLISAYVLGKYRYSQVGIAVSSNSIKIMMTYFY